jgi:hypothetical protein
MKTINPPFKTIVILWIVIVSSAFLYASCGAKNNKTREATSGEQMSEDPANFLGTTIDIEISNKTCLAIFLAKDGAINRKGTMALHPDDKEFFIGTTKEPVFDRLVNTISNELLEYCNKPSPPCDTTRPACKARISFGNNASAKSFEYCVNGTFNDLPAPIKNYVTEAVRLTDPWYENQRKSLKAK